MKTNLPVTRVEQPYPKGQYLVSKTDLKGVVTYANDAFVDISGFSREELIGSSHNVVRHPEMPVQAFADLWRTIKSGNPWQGLVKNRCKNGDFYWVKAFVVPIVKNGKACGYMSVRSEPTRQEIAEAEKLYARLNAGQGALSSEPPWHQRLSLAARLYTLAALTALVLVVGAYIGISSQRAANHDLKAAYEGRLQPSVAIAKMVERLGDNRAQIMLALQHSPTSAYLKMHDHSVDMHIEATLKNRELIESLRKTYEASPKSPAEQALAIAFFEARDRFSREGVNLAREAIKAGDYDKAQVLLLNQINPLYRQLVERSDALQNHLAKEGEDEYRSAVSRFERTSALSMVGAVVAILVIVLSCVLLARSLSAKLRRIIHHFGLMAEGNLTDRVDIRGRDEPGQVLTQLACMQVSLKVMLDEVMAASRQIEAQSRQVEWQTASVVDQSEQQRDKATTVAAATEEFSQSVREVAEAAAETAGAADQAQVQVGAAQSSMNQSMTATGRVVQAVQQSSNTIQELNQAIAKIGDITDVIREIADQTNLLALNAAIEAARAGEAGRGFAVVADEVRKLAERTALSTKDIASNVTEIRHVTDQAVSSMAEAVAEVETGITLIRESGEGLSQITSSSQHVMVMSREIASAAKEQVVASETVAQNMERVVQLVDGNLEAAGSAKAAVDEMVATAHYLNKIVGRFKLND